MMLDRCVCWLFKRTASDCASMPVHRGAPGTFAHFAHWRSQRAFTLVLPATISNFRVYSQICISKTPFMQNLGFPCISCIPTKMIADFFTFPTSFHHLIVGVMIARFLRNDVAAKKSDEEVFLGSRGIGTHAHFRRHSQQMLWFSHQASSSRRAADRERSTAECRANVQAIFQDQAL